MFDVVVPSTGGAIATREAVIAPLTHSIGFDLEILMSPDRP